MKRLSLGQVRSLHSILIQRTGGTDGLRDEGLLESALLAPFMSFAGEANYPSLESKAARLAFGIVKNHPFVDGNKRTGILVMLAFLEINNAPIKCSDDELIALGLGLADGSTDEKAVLEFIMAHS